MTTHDRIFPVYKPPGMTSHDVVAHIRRLLPRGTKVGHAGTLDPLAEGVLVIAIGSATKRIADEVAKEKEYVATFTLGTISTTDDEEGEKTQRTVVTPPSAVTIQKALGTFVGTIAQVPPTYSAVKLHGTPAYTIARKGKVPQLEPRQVLIKAIELLSYDWPLLTVRMVTGPGVYVRSIARDLGEALGTGGYMSNLLRTRVGEYTKEDALSLEGVADFLTQQR